MAVIDSQTFDHFGRYYKIDENIAEKNSQRCFVTFITNLDHPNFDHASLFHVGLGEVFLA